MGKIPVRKRVVVLVLAVVLALPEVYAALVMLWAYWKTPSIVEAAKSRLKVRFNALTPERRRILLQVEDPAFYTHNGIDLNTPGVGYTTITQALVKIHFYDGFSPEFLRLRKIEQTLIAWVFNRRVDKETQLDLFINSAYLGLEQGREVIGLEEGARIYFGRSLTELDDAQYLALVAMLVSPHKMRPESAESRERIERIRRLLKGECRPESVNDVYYEGCASP